MIISLFLSSGFTLSPEDKFDVKHTQIMEKILDVVERLISNFVDVTVDIKPFLESLSAQLHFEYEYNNMIYPVQDQDLDFVQEIPSISLPLSDFQELEPLADEFVLYVGDVLNFTLCIKVELLGINITPNATPVIELGVSLADYPDPSNYTVEVYSSTGQLLYEDEFENVGSFPIEGLNSTALITNIRGERLAIGFIGMGEDAGGKWAEIKAETNFTCWEPEPEVLQAEINIDPDTLNLKSKGKWITTYIEFEAITEMLVAVELTCIPNDPNATEKTIRVAMAVGETEPSFGEPSLCGYEVTLLEINEETTDNTTFYVAVFEATDGVNIETTGSLAKGDPEDLFNGTLIITVLDFDNESTIGTNVMTIDVNTVVLIFNNETIAAENNPKYGFVKDPKPQDTDEDGIPEFMVKFERKAVQEMLASVSGFVELIVKGEFEGGEFEGSDTIRVI